MDNVKNIVTGSIITLLIGGTAYTFSQQDVIDNFANDSGLTAEQAEQYVQNIPEEELASWEVIGTDLLSESEQTLALVNDIDCVNYEYEWETPTLSCSAGKAQLQKIATSEQSLGQAYIQLSSDTATQEDMRAVIGYIDQVNIDYEQEISLALFERTVIDEIKMTNIYNKSLVKAALESAE